MAELIPPQGGTPELAADALLAEAVRNGWLRPPLQGAGTQPPRMPVAPLADLLKELEGDRADR